MMKILPIRIPGALVRGLAISSAPAGTRAMRSRASLILVAVMLGQHGDRVGMQDDFDIERLGNRLDGDVVVRRADAAGGE